MLVTINALRRLQFNYWNEEPVVSLSKMLVLIAALFATPAVAHDFKAGDLTLIHPWARATPPGAPVAGGFVIIRNSGRESDRLLSVTSSVAESVEIHQSSIVDGTARMRPVANLEIAPGQEVMLAPGGYHLMFLKPKTQFRQSEKFSATLVFEKAGSITVEFAIQGIGSAAPAHDGHGK